MGIAGFYLLVQRRSSEEIGRHVLVLVLPAAYVMGTYRDIDAVGMYVLRT